MLAIIRRNRDAGEETHAVDVARRDIRIAELEYEVARLTSERSDLAAERDELLDRLEATTQPARRARRTSAT